MERGTVRVKCLAPEHSNLIRSPTAQNRARFRWTVRGWVNRTNCSYRQINNYIYLQRYKTGKELSLVSEGHRVANYRNLFFDAILDWDRGDIFTASSDNQLCKKWRQLTMVQNGKFRFRLRAGSRLEPVREQRKPASKDFSLPSVDKAQKWKKIIKFHFARWGKTNSTTRKYCSLAFI